jgi:hypothetical protein
MCGPRSDRQLTFVRTLHQMPRQAETQYYSRLQESVPHYRFHLLWTLCGFHHFSGFAEPHLEMEKTKP